MNPNTTTPDTAALEADVDALASPAVHDAWTGTIDRQAFDVRPLEVRQVFPFLKLARPMLAALANRPSSSPPAALPPSGGADGQGGSSTEDVDAAGLRDAEWMLDLIEHHGPNLVKALAIAVDAKPEAVEKLTIPGLVTLLKHFLVINAGFLRAQGLFLPLGLLAPNSLAAGVAAAVAPQAQS